MTEPIDNTSTNDVVFTADGRIAGTTEGSIDYKLLYESQRDETERLRLVVQASRLNASTAKDDDRKPAITAAQLEAMMGRIAWLNSTRNEKLVGLGLNPSEVDDNLLKELFAKGNDGKRAQDLYKSSPFRYRQLKNAAEALSIYCE